MSKLVIVESPAKAKTIKKYLGTEYEVIASKGHVRDLPAARLNVDTKHDFAPKYQIIKGKEELVKELREKVAKSTDVFLATDPDREGEAISWHLATILGLDMEDEKVFSVSTHQTVKVFGKLLAHDPDGDELRYEIVTYAKGGTLELDAKTGEIGEICYHNNKVKMFKKVYGDAEIDEFYTDSMSDKPLMDISKTVFLVDGDKILKIKKDGVYLDDKFE